jgi:gliding motility-associated-like protein
MQGMKHYLFFVILFFSSLANASHIVGGDIYYDYLGNNNYRFYITVYRDCLSTGAEYDDPLPLGIYTQNSSAPYQTVYVPFPGSVILPVVFNNPCVIPPNNICVEKAVYTVIVNLPPIPGGYTVSYQRCCRGPNITNLFQPDDTGLTLSTQVPGSETNATVNSSPRFTNYPPLLLCNNDDLIFDHSATDPDGDQLVYSLITPFDGGSSAAPAPNPPPGPPYFNVTWAGGFNAANPLGAGASISIDPNTGILTASPQMIGLFVVAIRVQEFRNGVLIGETVRDFLFRVMNCNITMQAILPTQEQLPTFVNYCQGLAVSFENNSYGGTNYAWDFGVSGTNSDVSAQFEPTFTYPAPGTYNAMLVVNPGWPCTDTAYMVVNVNNEFNVAFTTQDSVCILNNSLDFTGITDGPASTTFSWEFGPNANPATSVNQNVNNVSFSVSGFIPVTINAEYGDCEATFTESIYIFPEPTAGIVLPINFECDGLTIPFGNNSTNTIQYEWDFGVPGTNTDVSTAMNPNFSFPTGGTYTITLIGSSDNACRDTVTETITVYEPLSVSFTHNDSMCVTSNSFNFDGTMTGPDITTFSWNFGPNASTPTATTLDVNNVVYNTFGSFPVTLTASFNSCIETATSSVFIFREPEIGFSVLNGPRCAPALVQFQDESVADSPIYYIWNFGDESMSSSVANPSHIYSNPGTYSVNLEIYTTVGCIDTLSLLQNDIITIHPSPVSDFTVDPKQTDICNAAVTFTDQSQGATSVFYWFDDNNSFSNTANVTHTYTTSGWLRPMQVATNEFGCRDTSYQELYIEPFIIYFPNTFTPDGDEFNNLFNGSFALQVVEWNLKIFNKWGELLFESEDPNIGWDGTFGGKLMQDATYTYELRYISCENKDEPKIIKGHVNLLR